MALRLADEEIIPFDYMSYTTELEVTPSNERSNIRRQGHTKKEDRSKPYELELFPLVFFLVRHTQK